MYVLTVKQTISKKSKEKIFKTKSNAIKSFHLFLNTSRYKFLEYATLDFYETDKNNKYIYKSTEILK